MLEPYSLKETADLIDFIHGLSFNRLPTEVVNKAKHCLMDTIGCAFAGLKTTEHAQIVTELVKDLGGSPEARVWGDGFRTTTVNSAMANGTSSHGLDLDDAHRRAFLHVGVGTIPAVVALAEKVRVDGRQVITATVVAFEVAIRLALAVNPTLRLKGFHTTGTVGVFGAAMGAGKILGLNPEQLVNALGLAGTQSAGLWQFNDDGDMSKRFHAGKAAANGLLATLLAQKGLTGPYRVLEGRFGFPAAFVGEYKPEMVNQDLGEKFHILEVGFKIHAACRYTNTPIDAALALVQDYGFKPEDVDQGTIKVCKIAADQLKKKKIDTLLDAQISGPFCVALAIARGQAGYQDFLAGIHDAAVLELTRKFEMVEEPRYGLQERTATVEIKTKDGRVVSREVHLAKGEPEVPLSSSELENKYRNLASALLEKRKIDQSLDLFGRLEKIEDITALVDCLVS
jgi:2-methylcitrate dehydratase PrpD